jgi:hypothetical protein
MLISSFHIAEISKLLWLMEFSTNEVRFQLSFRLCAIVLEVDSETKNTTRETEEKLHGRYKKGHVREKPK